MQDDLYGLLGVPEDATDAQIKKAALNLLRIWHPDKCGTTKPRTRFEWIQAAYKILSDPVAHVFWNERIARQRAQADRERARIARFRAKLLARRDQLAEELAQRTKNAREPTLAEPAPEPATPSAGVEANQAGPSVPQPLPKKRPRDSGSGSTPDWGTRPTQQAPVLSKTRRKKREAKDCRTSCRRSVRGSAFRTGAGFGIDAGRASFRRGLVSSVSGNRCRVRHRRRVRRGFAVRRQICFAFASCDISNGRRCERSSSGRSRPSSRGRLHRLHALRHQMRQRPPLTEFFPKVRLDRRQV